jgi:hypothetical protein
MLIYRIANIGNDWKIELDNQSPSPFSLLPNYRWSKAKGANPQNAYQYWELLGNGIEFLFPI